MKQPTKYSSLDLESSEENNPKDTCCKYIRSYDGRNDYEDVLIICNVAFSAAFCHVLAIALSIMLLISILILFISNVAPQYQCLGAPYLYITTHGRSNIYKYSRDGCLITDKALKNLDSEHTSFRSMVFGKYQDIDDALFIACAKDDPQVMVYGSCLTSGKKYGERDYITTLVNRTVPGAEHGYGIALDQNGTMYVSFQHTDLVLRFDSTNYSPIVTLPAGLTKLGGPLGYYPGAFYQIYPIESDDDHKPMEGIRGIIVVDDNLWIANEDTNSITIVNLVTGNIFYTISIETPIGLYFDRPNNLVYVGISGKENTCAISYNSQTFKKQMEYKMKNMLVHTAGIIVHGTTLFIADQESNAVYTFNTNVKDNPTTLIPFPVGVSKDNLEGLALSSC